MRVYTNSLGITCIEPAEGCLLKKGNQTFKKVYLGKNDRTELYEEIKDESYEPKVDSIQSLGEPISGLTILNDECILVSPNGNQFKLTISDDGTLSTKRI